MAPSTSLAVPGAGDSRDSQQPGGESTSGLGTHSLPLKSAAPLPSHLGPRVDNAPSCQPCQLAAGASALAHHPVPRSCLNEWQLPTPSHTQCRCTRSRDMYTPDSLALAGCTRTRQRLGSWPSSGHLPRPGPACLLAGPGGELVTERETSALLSPLLGVGVGASRFP